MNMKKTIAAIAAGAVAVSAMATTVSALSDATLHYNLFSEASVATNGSVQVSGTVTEVAGGADIQVGFAGLNEGGALVGSDGYTYTLKSLTVIVKDSAGGAGSKTFQYNTAWGSDNWYDWNISGGTVTIPAASLDSVTVESYDVTIVGTFEHNREQYNGSATEVTQVFETDGVTVTAAGTTNEIFVTNYKDQSVETRYYPLETTISGASITNRLAANNYVNATAVLNDAIENYESVVFTFNTAANGLKWEEDGDAYYNADWDADYSYMSFGQHLYNNFYNPENTGYLGLDWTGVNLFQGALVVNEGLTMSLADTDYFDWTATSLSFDWDAIMDGALTTNDYATFIRTLKLATSQTWYWDSMDVVLTAGAAEDGVDAEAGVAADDEELAEEEVEVEEEVVEEVEVEEEAEVEVEVSNPTTGNASVALAVIPVALAAAAVVAKKRS